MSEIVIGELDRQLRGSLKCTLNTDPTYVAFHHIERDGREGGRLVVKIEELDVVIELLIKAKAIASGSKPKHRTLSASEAERELERKLF